MSLIEKVLQFNKIILPVKSKPRLFIVAITGNLPLKNTAYKTQFPENILAQDLTARGIYSLLSCCTENHRIISA